MEKSAFNTTLAHGPGQPAGGVNENGLGEKSAKATLLNSVTKQGGVSGRVSGGSAVAVFPDPITRPGDGIVWAESAPAASSRPAMIKTFVRGLRGLVLAEEKTLIYYLQWRGSRF